MLRIRPMLVQSWFVLSDAERLPADIGQSADQPVRFDGIGDPRFRPTLAHTRAYGARVDLATVFVEQGQFAARLIKTALQPTPLDPGGSCGFLRRIRFCSGVRRHG